MDIRDRSFIIVTRQLQNDKIPDPKLVMLPSRVCKTVCALLQRSQHLETPFSMAKTIYRGYMQSWYAENIEM